MMSPKCLKFKSEKIAVYGTLKQGHGNHAFYIAPALKDGRAKFLGKGKTEKKYAMYCAGIPFVVDDKEVSHIDVEVYEIFDKSVMDAIDSLEGHPYCYERRKVNVILENGEKVSAWMYFYKMDLDLSIVKLVESGNYDDVVRS